MSNVFVYASSFAAKTIIYKIGYLLNITVEKVNLLKENHALADDYFNKCDVEISLYENIDDCIQNSDYILVLWDEKLPEVSLRYIQCQASKLGKKCYRINNSWDKENIILNKVDESMTKFPIVLTISLGMEAQSYCMELLLNKMFTDKKISFKQIFSNETRTVLEELEKQGILNDNLVSQIKELTEYYDVIIASINLDSDINSVTKYIEIFKYLNPDFVVLQTDIQFDQYDIAQNIVKYNCFSQLEMLVKSHFRNWENKFIVYCDKEIIENDIIFDLYSKELEEKMMLNVLAKLAFPKSVDKI